MVRTAHKWNARLPSISWGAEAEKVGAIAPAVVFVITKLDCANVILDLLEQCARKWLSRYV